MSRSWPTTFASRRRRSAPAPIEERRSTLLRLVVGVSGILFSETLAAEGAVVFAKACELDLEGVVSKREEPLLRGKSRNWLKIVVIADAK
jgi:ATP-dependent DNA ligase